MSSPPNHPWCIVLQRFWVQSEIRFITPKTKAGHKRLACLSALDAEFVLENDSEAVGKFNVEELDGGYAFWKKFTESRESRFGILGPKLR
jgi:hypothetical protein